jgi:hypothetical protein
VKHAPVTEATIHAETRFKSEAPRQRTVAKTICQKLADYVRSPIGIVSLQNSGEHGQ